MKPYKRLFSTLILLLFTNFSYATDVSYGLGFNDNNTSVAERTCYDVFDGWKVLHNGVVRIAFELNIYKEIRFGHILNIDGEGDEFNIVLVPFREREHVWLDFNAPANQSKLSAPVPTSRCKPDVWHFVELLFDTDNNRIDFRVDSLSQSIDYDLTSFKRFRCQFGRSAKSTDVASMVLRNVEVCDGRRNYTFPLDQHSGTDVFDTKGKRYGSTVNPRWEHNAHHYWVEQCSVDQKSLCAVAYDTRRHNILVYNVDSVLVWNLESKAFLARRVNNYPNRFAIDSGGVVYDSTADRMIVYNPLPRIDDRHSLAVLDYTKNRFEATDLALAPSRLNHHNTIVEYSSGERNLWLFGGYGNHSYSNRFLSYDAAAHQWVEKRFEGNELIDPRFFSSIGKLAEGRYWLFGGFGNHSGNQSDGANYYYDLFEVDFHNQQVHRLTEFGVDDDNQFIPVGNLVISPDQKSFYAFCYDHNKPRPKGAICRFDLDKEEYAPISDSIQLVSEKIESNVGLWYDEVLGTMVCAVKEYNPVRGVNIKLYTLLFPPLPISSDASLVHDAGNATIIWWAASALLLCLIISLAVVFIARKRRSRRKAAVHLSQQPAAVSAPTPNRQPNSIFLMGDFCVYDRSGNDISFRFSTRLRQLLILLIVNSDADHDGISSEEISALLWADKEDSSNIRRVTFKNLRDVLVDIEGVEIISVNSKWSLRLQRPELCDYLYLMSLPTECETVYNPELIAVTTEKYLRGTFLRAYNYAWLDPYRLLLDEHSSRILMSMLNQSLLSPDKLTALKLTTCLLTIDPLNTDAFKIELSLLRKIGRQQQAELKFHIFDQEYFKTYNRHLSAKDFL